MTDHAPFLWCCTAQFGNAGYVTLIYNLDPCKLSLDVRDGLLSIAAQLVNWHHEDVEATA
jgi:hypothetical protein